MMTRLPTRSMTRKAYAARKQVECDAASCDRIDVVDGVVSINGRAVRNVSEVHIDRPVYRTLERYGQGIMSDPSAKVTLTIETERGHIRNGMGRG